MREIAGNLKQDVKELLGESAGLVTGFFKRGACTVRAVADKWKAFAHEITDAVDTLMKPPFAEGGPEAPERALDPEAEPVVTVTESMDGNPAVGLQMPLSQANALVGRLDREYREADYSPAPVTVRIDYMKDGQTDRYWLPLQIGGGGDLLEQMQARVESYRGDPDKVARLFESVPEAHREELRAAFAPAVQESLNDLSTGVLHHFRRHCDITALEQHFQTQAAVLPEREQQTFRAAAGDAVTALRRVANTGEIPRPAPQRAPQSQEAPAPETSRQPQATPAPETPRQPQATPAPEIPRQPQAAEKPRQSVKVALRQMKEAAPRAKPPKVRLTPQR